jgi:FtsP/CotA-like multicopper oxidase with cupredoxin domain
MRSGFACRALVAFSILFAPYAFPADQPPFPVAAANDNRIPAGHLQNGVLELKLELRASRWYPESETDPSVEAYAFAESGGAPQISGPLIRVPQGTQIHVSVHNTLAEAAKLYGLNSHPSHTSDALSVAPGETRQLQFDAGEPGTYLYWATTTNRAIEDRDGPETTLGGAFVVDAPGAPLDDRIFVLLIWTKDTDTPQPQEVAAINGKSWPESEHLTYKAGQTIHWRIVNPSFAMHGMHLHGFYFTVDGVGDSATFVRYSEAQRRQLVTEGIDVGRTFEMTWTPERTGNWLFHCHMVVHMSPSPTLHPPDAKPVAYPAEHDHSAAGMGGLVLGITVTPGASATSPATVDGKNPRKVQLIISDNAGKVPLYQVEVIDPALPPAKPDEKRPPTLLGPPIILTRGEPVEIEVKNQLSKPTAIHWHGIELESYYDGVPGWTGSGTQTTPPIAPGTSFIARMAPPRAGTFIYHTHWHDDSQILNGVYGPLIVLEPGQKYNRESDINVVFGTGNYPPFGFMLLANGNPAPDPLRLRAGKRYRIRFVNITDNASDLRLRLSLKDETVPWKVVAKDGQDLPAPQLQAAPADMILTVGATCDVELQVDKPGYLTLLASSEGFQGAVLQPLLVLPPK